MLTQVPLWLSAASGGSALLGCSPRQLSKRQWQKVLGQRSREVQAPEVKSCHLTQSSAWSCRQIQTWARVGIWVEALVRSAMSTWGLRSLCILNHFIVPGTRVGREDEVSCKFEEFHCFLQGHWLCFLHVLHQSPVLLAFHPRSLQLSIFPPAISNCIEPKTDSL